MTVWFGVGLIVYVHLAMLLVGFVCTAEARRLRIRVKDLEAKSPPASPSLRHAVNREEGPAARDIAVQQPHGRANAVPDPSATRSNVGELAAQGLSPDEIARQTGTPRVEVDFLLKLRQIQKHTAKSAAS